MKALSWIDCDDHGQNFHDNNDDVDDDNDDDDFDDDDADNDYDDGVSFIRFKNIFGLEMCVCSASVNEKADSFFLWIEVSTANGLNWVNWLEFRSRECSFEEFSLKCERNFERHRPTEED